MTDLSEASREIMWNISPDWLMYALFAVSVIVFAWGLIGRIKIWKRGKSDNERLGDFGKRFVLIIREIALQRRVNSNLFPGLFHSFIFYSFAILVITTAVIMLDYDFGTSLFRGRFYLFLSLAADVGGLFILIGLIMAALRRYVQKPKTIDTVFGDTWALLIIALIVVSGFLTEGLRMAVEGDQWPAFSPVGYLFSLLFTGTGAQLGASIHTFLWWGHTVLALVWIASIPYTKFFHILTLPTNVFFAKFGPRGELKRFDIEATISDEDFDEEQFRIGVQSTDELTWKQRLDLDACIGCGRCEELCPSYIAGLPFSPKQFIQSCKDLLYEREQRKISGDGGKPTEPEDGENPGGIVGAAFEEDFIWHCRTCMMCVEVCPACIDHVDTMIEIRRNEVVMQGRLPSEAARALKILETQGNPFGPQEERVDWIAELGVPVVGPNEECDILYWIGCCTSFDPTKRKIASDLTALLQRCGTNFAVLGADEKCCGDPARVLGQEYIFQAIAKEQVELLNSRKFRMLLVSCPHCYNVFKNEYPQFGGHYNVVHYSEFLHEMLRAGVLKPRHGRDSRIVYHDPCYLGRYQKIYDSPREVLKAIPGARVTEMKMHADRSMCCGGGGGHFWMDIKEGERINNLRVKQARDAGADTIVTSCPYCMHMLDDSIKIMDMDDTLQVVDIAELVLNTLEAEESVG